MKLAIALAVALTGIVALSRGTGDSPVQFKFISCTTQLEGNPLSIDLYLNLQDFMREEATMRGSFAYALHSGRSNMDLPLLVPAIVVGRVHDELSATFIISDSLPSTKLKIDVNAKTGTLNTLNNASEPTELTLTCTAPAA